MGQHLLGSGTVENLCWRVTQQSGVWKLLLPLSSEAITDSDLLLGDQMSLMILLTEVFSCPLGVRKHLIGIPDDFFLPFQK